MDIRDAMAEAILRDVLANPGKYPGWFVEQSAIFKSILGSNGDHGKMRDGWPLSTDKWISLVSEYQSTVLPDESPDQKPERDGEQTPDARNFENKE